MSKVRPLPDASALDTPPKGPRKPSPRTLALRREYEQFREQISALTGPDKAFAVDLEPGEKWATVRLRLIRISNEFGRPIVVRKQGDSLFVGLMTPERKSRRGRPRKVDLDA